MSLERLEKQLDDLMRLCLPLHVIPSDSATSAIAYDDEMGFIGDVVAWFADDIVAGLNALPALIEVAKAAQEVDRIRETAIWAEGFPAQRNPWVHHQRLSDAATKLTAALDALAER